jgi:EpsI family protein
MKKNAFITSAALLLAALAAVALLGRRGQPVVLATNLERLPYEIAGFRATDDSFDPAVYDELNADFHLYRHYLDAGGQQVDLYIGYYGTAKGGRTPHNPYACLPGAGWGVMAARPEPLITEDAVEVNYLLARKGEMYQTVLHWYQSNGDRVLATGLAQNVQRFVGRLLHNRNDGAFVRVSIASGPEDLEGQLALARSFAGEVKMLLPGYWPVEGEL